VEMLVEGCPKCRREMALVGSEEHAETTDNHPHFECSNATLSWSKNRKMEVAMPATETLSQKRERRDIEGKEAWQQYNAEQKHIDENMHRLRAERLAREAEPKVIVMKSVKKKKAKKA
jgi:hypothetical protein